MHKTYPINCSRVTVDFISFGLFLSLFSVDNPIIFYSTRLASVIAPVEATFLLNFSALLSLFALVLLVSLVGSSS